MPRTINVPHPEDEFGKNPIGRLTVPDTFSDERTREEITKAQNRYQELNLRGGQTYQERKDELMEERDAGVRTLASIGTGAARELASGMGWTAGMTLAPHEPSVAMNVYEGVQENFPVYNPQDEKSQAQLQAVQDMARPVMMGLRDVFSRPKQTLLRGAESAGLLKDVPTMTGDEPVHPAISTTAETITLGALDLLGAGRGIPNRVRVNNKLGEIEDQYRREFGIELGSAEIREQLARSADARTAEARGEALIPVRDELVRARDQAKRRADEAYEAARTPRDPENPASVRSRSLEELQLDMQAQLERGYSRRALERMDAVQDIFGEIDDLRLDAERTTLTEIDDLRRQISNLRSRRGDATPQDNALTTMKGQLDKWIRKKHNEDMILGDPENLKQWEDARGLWSYYKKNFKEDRVIKNFVEQEANPEMLRHWLLNSSKTGFKKEAGLVVNKLKNILGPENPAINGIRAEFMFDIVQPLLKEEPDLKGFISKYDEAVKNNSGLIKELDVKQSDLNRLRDLAQAAKDTKAGAGFLGKMDAPLIISRVLLGNRLAKATLRQNLLRQSIVAMHGRGESAQRQMIREMVGYDPHAPIIPKGTLEANSVIAEVFTNALEDNNDQQNNRRE